MQLSEGCCVLLLLEEVKTSEQLYIGYKTLIINQILSGYFDIIIFQWDMLIGVSGSFFRGGQQLHPAKIQSLPAEISSCQNKNQSSVTINYGKFALFLG